MKQLLTIGLLACWFSVYSQTADKISFIVFGDMPYHLPQDFVRFERLIDYVNQQDHAFNVHVGDIKSSSSICSEEHYQKMISYFNRFKKPLIYTPGDNEWTDCNKREAGEYDPEERLGVIRKMFFLDDFSFGNEKIKTIGQTQMQWYSKFVENRLWQLKNITFATLHVVGSNNNFSAESKNLNQEFFERNKANIAWLGEIFAQAKKTNSPALVIFMQADMFYPEKSGDGFEPILKELKKRVIEFAKPVVLVNGDSHKFLVDKPMMYENSTKAITNFTRVQVFGEEDIHAVRIQLNTTSGSFQVEQILIPEN